MKIKLRSKRLVQLFTEVWEHLPEADRTLLFHKTKLVVDNPVFLPSRKIHVWGMAMGIGVTKSISIIYLSPRKLPRQPDSFVRYVIAHELAHIFCGHADELFLSQSNALVHLDDQARLESEADQRAREWGFLIVPPTQTPNQLRSSRKRVSHHKT